MVDVSMNSLTGVDVDTDERSRWTSCFMWGNPFQCPIPSWTQQACEAVCI